MSGKLLGNANISGRVDTELNNLVCSGMASSETEARRWEKKKKMGVWVRRVDVAENWWGVE